MYDVPEGLSCLSVSAANDDLELTPPIRIRRPAPSSLPASPQGFLVYLDATPLRLGTELGVAGRAMRCAAATTGRLLVKPGPFVQVFLSEHRKRVNKLGICIGFGPSQGSRLEWKASLHGSKAPCRRLGKSIPLDG